MNDYFEELIDNAIVSLCQNNEDYKESEPMITEDEFFSQNFMESKTAQDHIISLHTHPNFWRHFENSKFISNFSNYFPNISFLQIELKEYYFTSKQIPAVKLPRCLKNLYLFLILSQSENVSDASAFFFEEVKQLPLLSKLNLYIEANNDLLTLYYQVVDMLSHCNNLTKLIFNLGKYFSYSSTGITNNEVLEAFPLSNLFETLSKFPYLKHVWVSIPLLCSGDIPNLLKINIPQLTEFILHVNDPKRLKNEDQQSLMKFITKHTKLSFLDMRMESDMDDIGAKNFYYQLSTLKSLKTLYLKTSGDNMTQSSLEELLKMIRSFKNLKRLALLFRFPLNDSLLLQSTLEQMHLEDYSVITKGSQLTG